MRLLSFINFTACAGVSHQKSNLIAMIKEATLSGRTLVVPEFRLEPMHNFGRRITSQLSEYFDYSSLKVNGMPISVIFADSECIDVKLLPSDASCVGESAQLLVKSLAGTSLLRPVYEKTYRALFRLKVELPVNPEISALARLASSRVSSEAVWVHARRGDKIRKTGDATTPENIRRVVSEVAPEAKVVYISTDEVDFDHFSPLKRFYTVMGLKDIDCFVTAQKLDNYRAFLAEAEFGKYFGSRISTFRTGNSYYQGSLSSDWGVQ